MERGSKEWVDFVLKVLVISFHKSDDLNVRLEIAKTFMSLKIEYIHFFQDDITAGVPDYEVWRNCEGWETIYQVSNFGRIRGHENFLIKTTKGKTMAVYLPLRIRTRALSNLGYVATSFWFQGSASKYLVHRLVARHFIPNPKGYSHVLHIDDNPGNPY